MKLSSVWIDITHHRSFRMLVCLSILGLLVTSGCASVTVVAAGDELLVPDERLQACSGAKFSLTISQNLPNEDPESVTVEGTAAGGQVRFTSRDLPDIMLNNIVTVQLTVLSIPGTQLNCPFEVEDVLTLGPTVLKRTDDIDGDPAYVVAVSDFKKQ